MNGAALALMGGAAVYGVIAGASARMASIRRLGSEYGYFALLSVCLLVTCLGEAVVASSFDVHGAHRGLRIEVAGVLGGLGAFTAFVHAAAERPLGRGAKWVLAFVIVSLVLDLAGLLFDPSDVIPVSRAFGPLAHPQPAASLVGKINSLVGVAACGYVAFTLAPLAAKGRTGSLLVPSCIVALAGWAVRTALYFAEASVGPLFGLLLAPFVSGVAATLLLRWSDLDDELRERNAQLEAAYVQLEAAQSELVKREQLAAVGELSAVIAHEVRNPLAVLKNAVSGLRKDSLSPELRETLHGILDQETDRLNRLVRDLLAYARPIHMNHDDVELAPLVERALATAQHGHPGVHADVVTDLAVHESIRGDRDQLERALSQLLDNAFDAIGREGRVFVQGRNVLVNDVEFVQLSVVDSGEGMDTLIRSRAKEPFFTTRKEGTGLGLAIVERVAAAHGGRLELARDDDGGTRATLFLPRDEPKRGRISVVPL